MSFCPIAIVGRGCVLPGALTPAALGALSARGADVIGAAPAGRWRIDDELVLRRPDDSGPDTTWSCRGGYVEPLGALDGIDRDALAAAFGPLGAGDLDALDPVIRYLLVAGRDALDDASMAGGDRVGAVVGNLSFPTMGMADYAERTWLARAGRSSGPGDPRARFMSGLPAHALARAFSLDGGAFAIDAACASSLVAIEIACAELAARRVDAMVAGAVNAADDLFLHMGFRALEALSPTGRSRPFHAEADGLVPAEGAALVVLERLDDALAAGRRIHGVIRGVGLSNDGRGRGLLVPSSEGQRRALSAAYRAADIDPRQLGWVECHATGTVVGDGTEIASMADVLAAGRAEPLPIGSLKANMGHLITAAGGAGLLRVLEAMREGVLPPTPHADRTIASLNETPFEVLTASRAWPEAEQPRLAGVSAFGFGGNNAHVIVQQWRDDRPLAAVPATIAEEASEIAVVALGARVGECRGHRAFAEALVEGSREIRDGAPGLSIPSAHAEHVRLPMTAMRFPPRDLEQTLPQQLLLMEVADEALGRLAGPAPDGDRASVFVGMQCDTAVARHGARWRMAQWGRAWGASEAWVDDARDRFAPLLGAAGVLGCMPNICANRLNSQLDWRGPSCTLSSEELSGLRGLRLAQRMLRERSIDVALVAAVDLCAEPAHVAAATALGITDAPGDAALALVLMRRDEAERRGETVLAVLDEPGADEGTTLHATTLASQLGHAHAASGLMALGAAVVACAHGRPAETVPVEEREGTRRAVVEVRALGGERDRVAVRAAGPPRPLPPELSGVEGPLLVRPVHDPAPTLPDEPMQAMAPAPTFRSSSSKSAGPQPNVARAPRSRPARPSPSAHAATGLVEVVERHGQRMLERHQAHLATQAEAFERYRAHQRAIWQAFVPAGDEPPPNGGVPMTAPESREEPLPEPPRASPSSPPDETSPSAPRGPSFDRDALAIHASGRISEIFGGAFQQQDEHAVQVRMPEHRLLLADRVTGIDAEPGVLGQGTVWTETDVTPQSWYLHAGRMPAGLMIEAGQADLFLISYMGIDFLNRGERAYRLLGCDVTYRRSLPAIGETLRYDIHVDDHAQQDDVRLFFFHYDCRIGDEIVLSVRNGQAGFFSEEELARSEGVIWDPHKQAIAEEARVDPPSIAIDRRDFGPSEIAAFAAGDLVGCFGPGFERTQSHTRTPTIQGGDMSFVDRIEGFDPSGGPWRRGYLLAKKTITPDLWFFDGHFKNDPCMPGTLMLEGCLQMMAFYLAALGHTVDRDGWRFEPVLDHSVNLRCRGQVLPHDEELVCEIFVEEVHDGPYPTVYADLLGTVNGLKAFHARRMGLRLVPDWPLGSRPDLPGGPLSLEPNGDDPVAVVDGFRFGYASLLACAWGKPSRAFGPMYAPFDDIRRVPRLPGPPYHFMSRVENVTGTIGGMEVGSTATIAYDVVPDAWYFSDNGAEVMPFAVLLETVLQPCGWLASYVGSALTSDEDLSFRNLDGDGVVHADVVPTVGTLTTRTTLTSVSQTAGMIIQSFDVTCHAGDALVYELKTVFGFFPSDALKNQIGLPTDDAQRAAIEPSGTPEVIATERWPQLASGRLLMLDRLIAFEPEGGAAGLGRAVAEKTVDPGEWFFAAHFFQDPVQPGSLGLEAILQLLQLFMLKTNMHGGDEAMRFEALRLGEVTKWKYRGQVVPDNRIITTDVTITEKGHDERGPYVVGTASLWVDGKRIYEASPIGMRLVGGVTAGGMRAALR